MPRREISREEISKHHFLMASPHYGGMCHSIFDRSISDLSMLCGQYSIPMGTAYLWNESNIARARNYCCDTFMRSPASHLLFVDGDIGFKAQDALELLILQAQRPECEIIGAPYRKKKLDIDYVPNGARYDPTVTEPVPCEELGTGFTLIARSALEKFKDAYPEYMYQPDGQFPFDGQFEIVQYFHAELEPHPYKVPVTNEPRRYLTEDYWFVRRCKEIGISTWLCPWMKVRHAGSFVFE